MRLIDADKLLLNMEELYYAEFYEYKKDPSRRKYVRKGIVLVKRIIENEEVTPTILPVYDSRTGRILYDARKHPNGEEYEEAKKTWNRRVDNG